MVAQRAVLHDFKIAICGSSRSLAGRMHSPRASPTSYHPAAFFDAGRLAVSPYRG